MDNCNNKIFDKQVNRNGLSGAKKIFIIIALVILAIPVLLKAQESKSISIKASAVVLPNIGIEMVPLKNLEIDLSMAENGIINVNPLIDSHVGLMLIKGKPDSFITISFTPNVELLNVTGRGTIIFQYRVLGFSGNNQASAEPLDAVNRRVRFNGDGEYYLWIGGMINVSKAHPGNYEGEFTLEIEYI